MKLFLNAEASMPTFRLAHSEQGRYQTLFRLPSYFQRTQHSLASSLHATPGNRILDRLICIHRIYIDNFTME